MKKVLLGTSALVGVALFANTASAQITVRLGGTMEFQAGFLTDDLLDSLDPNDDAEDGYDFRTDTEVIVRADGKADNGLLYGAKIEIEAGGGGNDLDYDEAGMYVAGDWGRLEFGDDDGASDALSVFAPVVGIGQIDGDFGEYGAPGTVIKPLDTGDSTKVTYFSPRFAGFQAGVSFAPHSGDQGDNVLLDEDDAAGGAFKDVAEVGAQYQTSFGQFAVVVGGGWTFGDAKPIAGIPNSDGDLNSFGGGVQVGWGGIQVGGGYVQSDIPGDDQEGWNVGAAYETGPWGIAAQYHAYETGGFASADTSLITAGTTYTVAPGLTVGADIGWFDVEQLGDDDDGFVGILATKVTF